ncbi:RloB family protein [uncultured Deefgea sp.]|uniref:RloB family protein n=1 Tax=uncultured Deefgea sp. TaxID=1304914 RepID=UPI0025982933|nr:RloB family protein [uncultured Deefgea sp.]
MARRTATFNRGQPKFKQVEDTLIICEDTNSNKTYLDDACHHFRSSAKIKVLHCGKNTPYEIVAFAKTVRAKYDKIYCVFDRDDHPNFDEALQLASDCNVETIKSYPCFELWYILHYKYFSKCIVGVGNKSSGDMLQKEVGLIPQLAAYTKSASKGLFFNLKDDLDQAIRHSTRRLKEANEDGSINPSTEIHLLISKIKELGELKNVA